MTRYLYEPGVGLRYYMDGAIIYECESGQPTFYVSGPTVFAYADVKRAYWIDGNSLGNGNHRVVLPTGELRNLI